MELWRYMRWRCFRATAIGDDNKERKKSWPWHCVWGWSTSMSCGLIGEQTQDAMFSCSTSPLVYFWQSMTCFSACVYFPRKEGQSGREMSFSSQGTDLVSLNPCVWFWALCNLNLVGRVCSPSTWETEAGESEVQGYISLYSKLEVSLGYRRPCHKESGGRRIRGGW